MGGILGRKTVLAWGGGSIAGVTTKKLTINGEPVDVSDDNSDGWKEVLAEAGEVSVEISVSGIVKNDDLKVTALANTARTKTLSLTYPDTGVLSGDFYLGNYSETGEYKDKITFEASFTSDGEVTFVSGEST